MKKIIKKILVMLMYLSIVLIGTRVYAATQGVTVNETTRIRKQANTTSEVVTLVSQNTKVEIISEEGEWYKVQYSKYTGYIRKDMLNITQTETDKENNNQENNNELPPQSSEEDIEIQTNYKGKVNSNLDIKILPSINSSVIATVYENTEFTVTDIINKWCHIETEQNSGWVLLSKVKGEAKQKNISNKEETTQNVTEEVTENKKEEEKTEQVQEKEKEEKTKTQEITKYVATETLNLRATTDNNAKIIEQLTLNSQVSVIETVDNTWSKVTYKGKTGYVASKYLSDKKTEKSSRSENEIRTAEQENNTAETTTKQQEASEEKETTPVQTNSAVSNSKSSGTGAEVVAYAKQYLGYKYVSGGTSPSTGFDCSGFTYYVFKHFGVTLNRASTAQINNGVEVSKSNLQEGDLIIFRDSANSGIGHVGIYIGGNTFIHAANAKKGVITTSLSDSYYSARYVTARRVI